MKTVDGREQAELSKLQKAYELLGELSRDEMVTVYVARDRLSGSEVAVKVLRAADARGREALAHYASDARMLTALEHPNIVAVHSVKWLSENVVAVVTERVRGPSLRQVLDVAGTLPVARATEVLKGLGRALTWAHSSQIMHRDVRPENVIFEDGTGRVVLSDFGLARRITSGEGDGNADAYRAPELADGRYPDRRTDVYSLGIVGWELLTGRRPWPDAMDPIEPGQRPPAPPPLAAVRPGLPPALVSALEGAVQLDRDRRIADVAAFLDRLTGVTPPPRPEPRDEDTDVETFAVEPSQWVAMPVPRLPARPAAPAAPAARASELSDPGVEPEARADAAEPDERERAGETDREVARPVARDARPGAVAGAVAAAAAAAEGVREARPESAPPAPDVRAEPESRLAAGPHADPRREREVTRAAERDVAPSVAPETRPTRATESRPEPEGEALASHGLGTPPPTPRPPSDSRRRKGKQLGQVGTSHQASSVSPAEPTAPPAGGVRPPWGPAALAPPPADERPTEQTSRPATVSSAPAEPTTAGSTPASAERGPKQEVAPPESPIQRVTGQTTEGSSPTRPAQPTATPSTPADMAAQRRPVEPAEAGDVARGGGAAGAAAAGAAAAAASLGRTRDATPASSDRAEAATAGSSGTAPLSEAARREAVAQPTTPVDAGPETSALDTPPNAFADAFTDPFQPPLSGPVRGPVRGGPFAGPLGGPLGGPIDGPTHRPERMRGGLGTPRAAWGDASRGDPTRASQLPPALDPVFDTPAEFPLPLMPDPRPMPADGGAGVAAARRSRWTRRGIAAGAAALLLAASAVTLARMERAPDTSAGLIEPETPEGYGGDVEVNPPRSDSVAPTPPSGPAGSSAARPGSRATNGARNTARSGQPATSGAPAGARAGTQPLTRPGARGAAAPAAPSNRGANAATVPRGTTTPARPSAAAAAGRAGAAASATAGAPPGRTAAARPAPARTPAAVNPARTWDERADGFARCDSPALADQRACISAHLARNDAGLNQVYGDVIAAMRRRANTAPGDPDPPEVQRLRATQRNWIARRDAECRRRGRGREGRLWANQRARCLEDLSLARGRELSNTLARLRRD